MTRIIRLFRAFWMEILRRLPFIIGIFIGLFLFGAVQSYFRIAEGVQVAKDNSDKTKILVEKVADQNDKIKQLQEQNNALGQQTKDLSAQNGQHIDCIAMVFAKYTRDYRPVTIQDLNSCQTTNSQAQARTQTSSSAPTNQNISQNPSTTQNKNDNTNPGQSNNNPEPPKKSMSERVVDRLESIIKSVTPF